VTRDAHRARGRGAVARAAHRTRLRERFRTTELNLVPLVDTFVSIVFFALTAATVGELTPVARGVTLPTSRVGADALQELTVGVSGSGVTVGTRLVVAPGAVEAAAAADEARGELPALGVALRAVADSIREARRLPRGAPVPVPLAIHGDRATRYATLARVMHTARLAGFVQLTLQVARDDEATP
jgi:biopolymer transport protein ExbD